jgi:hypothetical protein
MKKLLVLTLVIILLASCRGEAQSSTQVGDYQVEFLFETDGVKVYRFRDNGRDHYFTNRGETMSTYQSGKVTNNETIY